MNRTPSKLEISELTVAALGLRGIRLSAAQRAELTEIIDREYAGIVRWIIAGMTTKQRTTYLCRIAANKN